MLYLHRVGNGRDRSEGDANFERSAEKLDSWQRISIFSPLDRKLGTRPTAPLGIVSDMELFHHNPSSLTQS